ncbi:MAG: hypothetical protein RL141_951, partial [Candidatus Parcubacteria bacterium]
MLRTGSGTALVYRFRDAAELVRFAGLKQSS